MGKVHSIIATITLIFTISLVLIVAGMILFHDTSLSEIQERNKSFIWIMGLVVVMGSIILTRINGIFQQELNSLMATNNTKNDTIERQNIEIVGLNKQMIKEQRRNNENQAVYIDQIKSLNDSIAENTRRDNQTISSIDKLTSSINRFAKRVTTLEEKIRKHDLEIRELKK